MENSIIKCLNKELENKIHLTKMDGIDFDYLHIIFSNLSKIMKEIPSNTRRALYNHLMKSFVLYKDRVEMEITDEVYSFNLGTKKGHNEKFVVTPVERGGQGAKRTLLKVIATY